MKEDVQIKTELVNWAIEESQYPKDFLVSKKKYLQKLIDTGTATYSQLEDFASTCHVPFGFLFLKEAPSDKAYSPSFRTIKNIHPGTMSQNLKQTITDMEFKRDWMSSYRQEKGFERLSFFSSIRPTRSISESAMIFRDFFKIQENWFLPLSDENASFDFLRKRAESIGFLIMENGIVGNNTKRVLDINEFRGFFLSDSYAPLVFINSRDSTAPKIFTLIHECIHAFLDNVEDLLIANDKDTEKEQFINTITAEILMPERIVRSYAENHSLNSIDGIIAFGKYFKTSLTASAYRLLKMHLIEKTFFDQINQTIENQFASKKKSGGDFYATLNSRLSSSFMSAVISSVKNENTAYTDGFSLLGVSSYSSFEKLSAFAEAKANRQ